MAGVAARTVSDRPIEWHGQGGRMQAWADLHSKCKYRTLIMHQCHLPNITWSVTSEVWRSFDSVCLYEGCLSVFVCVCVCVFACMYYACILCVYYHVYGCMWRGKRVMALDSNRTGRNLHITKVYSNKLADSCTNKDLSACAHISYSPTESQELLV